MPKILIFQHIAAFFASKYDSISSSKKHHTVSKNQNFGCEAVFDEEIFGTTRKKTEKGCRLSSIFNAVATEIYRQKPHCVQLPST